MTSLNISKPILRVNVLQRKPRSLQFINAPPSVLYRNTIRYSYLTILPFPQSINTTYYRLCVKEIHKPNGYDPVKVTTLVIGKCGVLPTSWYVLFRNISPNVWLYLIGSKHDLNSKETVIWKFNFAFLQSFVSYSKSLFSQNVFFQSRN